MSTKDGYEKKDINPWLVIIYSVVGIFVLTGMIIFLINFFIFEKEQLYYDAVLKPESKELAELRSFEKKVLSSYQVLDAEKGIYQIPIDRAMQLIAAK